MPTMTAQEALTFHAAVVLGPVGVPRGEQRQRVLAVLHVMGLDCVAGTVVGGVLPGGLMLRGLSGGWVVGVLELLAGQCAVVIGSHATGWSRSD